MFKTKDKKSELLCLGVLFSILILGFMDSWASAQGEAVKMKKAVLVISSDAFRDEELLDPKQVLEESGIQVKIASTVLTEVKGMLGARVKPDILLSDVDVHDFDAIVFVGGEGASQYWDDPLALQLVRNMADRNRIVAAICIAPVTLANAGVLAGKRATVSSFAADQLRAQGADYTGRPVERDGNIITASGPTVSSEFAQEIVRALSDK